MCIVIYYKNSMMAHNIHLDLIVDVQFELFHFRNERIFCSKNKRK